MARVLFYEPAGYFGRAVAWWTDSRYSHVAVHHRALGIDLLSQAHEKRGVCVWRLDTFRPYATAIDMPWLDDEWLTRWLAQRWGRPYGWRDILGFLWPGKRSNRRGMICSELIGSMLTSYLAEHREAVPPAWLPVLDRLATKRPEDVHPGQLWGILSIALTADS